MKMNFKTLASFFKAESPLDEKPEIEDTSGLEDALDDADEEAPLAGIPTIDGIAVDQARVDALVAAELALASVTAELNAFGETAEARASFLRESGQLYAWYENQKKLGITPARDANTEEKSKAKKVHSITQEAMDLQDKKK
jgi:hypothetical protein